MDFFLINKQEPKQIVQPPLNSQVIRTDVNDCTIKRGDFIKMVYKEKGSHNMYKGYIGEVKVYRKGQEYAMVILHAMNDMKLMRVSIDHFVKIEY
jgi:hypothetical protein